MRMQSSSPIIPSALTDGWHPAILLTITREVTPKDWPMAEQSPTMYRWHFACWETPDQMQPPAPDHEIQSGVTSIKFSRKGRFQASKAYTWAVALLGEDRVGMHVDWDVYLPLPCQIAVTRPPGKDYVKIEEVAAWPAGQSFVTTMTPTLVHWRAEIEAAAPELPTTVPAPVKAAPVAPTPGPITPARGQGRPLWEPASVPQVPTLPASRLPRF